MSKKTKSLILDFAERTARTFVQTFAGALIIGQGFDLGTLKLAAVAGGLAVATGIAGTAIGSSNSASLLPKSQQPKS